MHKALELACDDRAPSKGPSQATSDLLMQKHSPHLISLIQSIVPGFLEKCNHVDLLRCACANKPGEQAPPPFIGGTVPTHKPLAASGKVLGTDFTDPLIRLVVNKEAAPVRDLVA